MARSARAWMARIARTPKGLIAVALAVVVGAGVIAVRPEVFRDPDPVAGGRDNRCFRFQRAERKFMKRMNKARRRSGHRKMQLDPELSKVARVHTRAMVRRNLLHHTPATKLRRRVIGWATLGENVGVGNTVRSLHGAFMNSPAHRRNILYSGFRHGGVGVVDKGGGRLWVTVVFEASRDPRTRLRMPRC